MKRASRQPRLLEERDRTFDFRICVSVRGMHEVVAAKRKQNRDSNAWHIGDTINQ